MANPNIASLSTIKGQTAYVVPSTTANTTSWTYDGSTSLTGLTPATNVVNKITGLIVSNQSNTGATATIAIGNNPTFEIGRAHV